MQCTMADVAGPLVAEVRLLLCVGVVQTCVQGDVMNTLSFDAVDEFRLLGCSRSKSNREHKTFQYCMLWSSSYIGEDEFRREWMKAEKCMAEGQ